MCRLFVTCLLSFTSASLFAADNADGHATYWAKNCKVSFDSPADRAAKILQFKTNESALDSRL